MAEEALIEAVNALIANDERAAAGVVAGDVRIDRVADEVERRCVCLIALRAPIAGDLQDVLAAFKIGVVIERVGDCARAVAEQVPMIGSFKSRSAMKLLKALSATAQACIRHALAEFVQGDPGRSGTLPRSIDEAGYLQDELSRDLLESMSERPSTITSSTCLLLASQKLVRVIEHAANIARVCHAARHGAQPLAISAGDQPMNATRAPEILIVEDDEKLAELLIWLMTREGFAVRTTEDGEEALRLAQRGVPDAVLLDWMVKSMSGLEVCRRLRQASETAEVPIIMLTRAIGGGGPIQAFETGADDYVTKPFSSRELVARVHAILRRNRPPLASYMLDYADLRMDVDNYKVWRGKKLVALGPTEFRLLRHFMQHPGRVFSRERLLDAVWGRDTDIEARTVDVISGGCERRSTRGRRPICSARSGPAATRWTRSIEAPRRFRSQRVSEMPRLTVGRGRSCYSRCGFR
jgi:two-component system phosphate regulon response regulator PhoB